MSFSQAEVEMKKELVSISEKLRRIDNKIKQLTIKKEYQEKQRCKLESSLPLQHSFPGRNVSELTRGALQTEQLKQILLEE